MARMRLSSVTTSTKFHKPRGLSRAIEAGGRITKRTSSRYRFGDHIGRFEAAEFTPSLFRAHVTARELASPPFEDVYIRACTNPGHPESASNMTTWVNSQFPRPDFHRQVQRHYGLQNDSRPLVCLFSASLRYWPQRREECCPSPEALTSWIRLFPPARAQCFGTSCGSDRSSQGSPCPRSSGGDSRLPRRRMSPGSLPVFSLRRSPVSTTASLDRIGVGIDTARYGHRVSFLRPDRKPAAKPLTVMENRAGYQALRDRLNQLHEQHPTAHFHMRIDAAGQYAVNLELFLRDLKLPMTISVGEPKRNKDYQKAHFPKRTTDDTESQAMARFAVVEQPNETPAPSTPMILLREVAGRLQSKVKQTTQPINRLHTLLPRVFPELPPLGDDRSAGGVLKLPEKYPPAKRIAQAQIA